MSVPKPYEVVSQNELKKSLKTLAPRPIILYFYEPDSNLCQLLEPKIEELSKEFREEFHFLALNISENKDLSYELNVMRCPSFLMYRDGKEIRRMFDVQYTESFDSEFREFLMGSFHFDTSSFQMLDSMNFTARVDTGFQLHLIGFMEPGYPRNWKIVPLLEDLKQSYPNSLVISLVNARNNSKILNRFSIKELPMFAAFQGGEVVERWEPVTNPDQFHDDVTGMIE
ncbi:MAG: thioredoxin domain-containing protein [bacterium]